MAALQRGTDPFLSCADDIEALARKRGRMPLGLTYSVLIWLARREPAQAEPDRSLRGDVYVMF